MQRRRTHLKPAQQNRFAIRGSWAAALVFCLGLTVRGETHHPVGYLPAVGPAPLRLLAVIIPSTNMVKLPPPPPPPLVLETNIVFTNQPVNAGSITTSVSSDPFGRTDDLVVAPDTVIPEGVISPQMLLQYFNKSTNGPAVSVTAPMDFRPPNLNPPPAPAPSRATYSTGP